MQLSMFLIFIKELKEVLRDKKTLIFMLALPTLIMPVLFNMMVNFATKAQKKARTESIHYAIRGGEYLPNLAALFEENESFKAVTLDEGVDFKQAISDETIKMGLAIKPQSEEKLRRGEQVTVELFFNNASLTSRVKQRASALITKYSDQERNSQLSNLGVASSIERDNLLEPVAILANGTAPFREVVGERLGGLLPYLFVLFCFLGSLYPAIDLGAGEKERGTLETLLLTPVPRVQVVMGKFLVIFTTGLTSSTLALTSMGFWLFTKGKAVSGPVGELVKTIQITDILLIGLMMVPIAAMFAALLLSISIYAKSFKEAQSYAAPFNFLVIIPAIIAMLPGVELDWTWAMVPITNISLAIKELIKGTMDYQMLIAILGSSTLIAGALLWFCTHWFNRESVLFRA